MRNIFIKMQFIGTNYCGYQVQKNGVTIMQKIGEAIYSVMGEQVDVKGCSRTDSGVHANEYCLNFKTESTIPCENILRGLNHYLPQDIAVFSCEEKPLDFHARYNCTAKEYIYKIYNGKVRNPFYEGFALHVWKPIDVDKLNRAAGQFVGRYDFSSFCSANAKPMESNVRTVMEAEVTREGDMVIFRVKADGFLYNMVRIMVGTLLFVHMGKIDENDILNIIKKKDRAYAGKTAAPYGLYLNRVFY